MMGAGPPPAQGKRLLSTQAALEECGTPRAQQGRVCVEPARTGVRGAGGAVGGLSPISSPTWCLWEPGSDHHQRASDPSLPGTWHPQGF